MNTDQTYYGQPILEAIERYKRQARATRRWAMRARVMLAWWELVRGLTPRATFNRRFWERYLAAKDACSQAWYELEEDGQNHGNALRRLHGDEQHVCDDFCAMAGCPELF